MAARISEILLYKESESEFFIKNPNLTKTILAVFFFFFFFLSKESKSEKKIVSFLSG